MNKITFILFLLSLTIVPACNVSTNAGAEPSASNNSNAEVLRNNVSEADTPQLKFHQINSKQPLVWTAAISFNNGTVESDGFFSEGDAVEAEFPGGAKLGTVIEVDVMNCGGFLATGKITYIDEDGEKGFPAGWKLKIVPETLAADAQEKIKMCHFAAEFPYLSNVFAVAPRNDKRKNIKIGKVDTRKLFASLDTETKQRANMPHKEIIREKNKLTLSNDNWTDIDGDGQIDLVKMSAACSIESAYTCSSLLLLINGNWKEIGFITPA